MANIYDARRDQVRKKASGVITPSATANTYGSYVTVCPDNSGGYVPLQVRAGSGAGAFDGGGETLTTAVRVTYENGATAEVETTQTAASTLSALSAANHETLFTDARTIVKIEARCKSSVNNSTARGDVRVVAL